LPRAAVSTRELALIGVTTAFTLAHSITPHRRGVWAWCRKAHGFPPLIEVLIAASIIYMALENVLRPNLRWRWLVTALLWPGGTVLAFPSC
jgi:hypothetical protein